MEATKHAQDFVQNYDTLLYRVRPGDSLTRILKRYHPRADERALQILVAQVISENPSITHPDSIFPDQLIHLQIPQQYCAISTPNHHLHTLRSTEQKWVPELERTWEAETPEGRNVLSTLAPLFMGAGSAKLSTIETTLKSNTPLLGEMVENYESYKDKAKTKGQYDYRRKTLVKKLTTNLGPTSLLLYGTRPPTEVMRISTTKGTNPTAPIDGEIRKMRRVSTLAKSGGVLLTAVGVGMACSEIASAKTQGEKNEILVESGGSVIGGVAYGLGTSVALFLMATPIGWVAGIAIGVGGVLTSYGVGQGSKAIYNAMGNKLDFAAITGVDQVCSAGKGMRVPMPRISNAAMSVL